MDPHYPDLKAKDLTARIKLYDSHREVSPCRIPANAPTASRYKEDDPKVKTTGAKAVLDQTLFDLEQKYGVKTPGQDSPASPGSVVSSGGDESLSGGGDDGASVASGSSSKSRKKNKKGMSIALRLASQWYRAGCRALLMLFLPTDVDEAPLKQGQGLSAAFYRKIQLYPITVECLRVLNACPFVQAEAEEKQGDDTKEMTALLRPALTLCEILAQHTETLRTSRQLTAVQPSNLCRLQENMLHEVNEVLKKSEDRLDGQVAGIFRMFTKNIAEPQPVDLAQPQTMGIALGRTAEAERDEDRELQAAIAASLQTNQTQQEARKTAIKHLQRSMGVEEGGDDAVEGRGDIPSVHVLAQDLPPTGLSFAKLLKDHNIYGHDPDILVDFQAALLDLVDVQGDLMVPKATVEGGRDGIDDEVHANKVRLADSNVRAALSDAGEAGLSYAELIKVLGVKNLGTEEAQNHRRSLEDRAVVVTIAGSGKLTIPKASIVIDPALLGMTAPQASAASKGKGKAPQGKGKGKAAVISEKTSSAEAKDDGKEVDNTFLSDARITADVRRIRDGILAHLRTWTSHFPQPSEGQWPVDFSWDEQQSLRSFLTSHLIEQGLLGKTDQVDSAAQGLLARNDFPISKAHHKQALISIIKELNSKHRRKTARKPEVAAEQGDVEEQEQDDDVEQGISSATAKKRKRAASAASSGTSGKKRKEKSALGNVESAAEREQSEAQAAGMEETGGGVMED